MKMACTLIDTPHNLAWQEGSI